MTPTEQNDMLPSATLRAEFYERAVNRLKDNLDTIITQEDAVVVYRLEQIIRSERDAELMAKIEEMRMRWELKYQEHNSSLGPDHEGLWYSGALYALDSMQSFLTQSKETI